MCGCITETDYKRAQGILERQLEHLRATREPIRSVPPTEMPGALIYGIDKAATKTPDDARAQELAGHTDAKGKPSQATLLADLALEVYKLGVSPDGRPFAYRAATPHVAIPLRSNKFHLVYVRS